MLCPDMKNATITLQGTQMTNDHHTIDYGKNFYIEILKCNDENKQVPECAP